MTVFIIVTTALVITFAILFYMEIINPGKKKLLKMGEGMSNITIDDLIN